MMRAFNNPIFVALVFAVTAQSVMARSWVDTIDPTVYTQAVIDPARSIMGIENDPFALDNDGGDKEILGATDSPTLAPTSSSPNLNVIETPTTSPTTNIEAPECADGQILHVLRMHDSWGDGWGNSSMAITDIVATTSTGDVSTTNSRYHVVSISQTTFMEEEKGDILFRGSLEDGYDKYIYLCIPIGTCYSIDVLVEGDWQDEIKWDISNAESCTGPAEACYEGLQQQETYAKGIAPAECRFSVPDEDGIFFCPFSCIAHTEAPSGAPTDQPSRAPLSPMPSLDPSSAFPSFSLAPVVAIFPSTAPTTLNVSNIIPSDSSVIPSDAPSIAPFTLAVDTRRPHSAAPVSSDAPSLVPSGATANQVTLNPTAPPSGFPSLDSVLYSTTTPVPTIMLGHGMTATQDPTSITSMRPTISTSPRVADDRVVAFYDYEEGQRVWASWMGMPEMYEGVIAAVNTDPSDGTKTYNITFTDDETFEAYLSGEMIFPIELTEEELRSRPAIVEGQLVQARFMGGIYWFDATVTKNNNNGTFSLLYSDGDEEPDVLSEYIRFEHYTDGTIVEVDSTDMMNDGWYTPSPAPSLTSRPSLRKFTPTANQETDESPSTAEPLDLPLTARIPTYQTLTAGIMTTSQTPTIIVETVQIVEKPSPLPSSNEFSFLDSLEGLLRTPNPAPSTAMPSLTTTGINVSFMDRLDSLLQNQASSTAPSAASSQFPTSTPTAFPVSNIAIASDSPSSLPFSSPESSYPSELPSVLFILPSSNPVERIPTVLLANIIPPSTEPSRGGAVLSPTSFPTENFSVRPTGMKSSLLPLIETEPLAPSGYPSATFSPILHQPVNDPSFVPIDGIDLSSAPSIAAQTTVEDATVDNLAYLDSFDLPESLREKITGNVQVNNEEETENFPAESDPTMTTTSSTALGPNSPTVSFVAASSANHSSEPTGLGQR